MLFLIHHNFCPKLWRALCTATAGKPFERQSQLRFTVRRSRLHVHYASPRHNTAIVMFHSGVDLFRKLSSSFPPCVGFWMWAKKLKIGPIWPEHRLQDYDTTTAELPQPWQPVGVNVGFPKQNQHGLIESPPVVRRWMDGHLPAWGETAEVSMWWIKTEIRMGPQWTKIWSRNSWQTEL